MNGAKGFVLLAVLGLAAALFFPAAAFALDLTGAGATFPYPLYSKYFSEYNKLTGVRVNYQSIGSGGGQRQLLQRTVHFGASDAPLSDEQLSKYPGKVIHIPTALGAVVPTYNLPGVKEPLRFTGELLADIFLGKVTRWSDPRIQRLNPRVFLPDLPIIVAHRSDGSGTTYIWVEYLSKVSPEWKRRVGVGTSVDWPVGIGGKGNEGVAGVVAQTPGAIGYVELIYALHNNLSFGMVQNKSGNFILADLNATSQAAAVNLPADTRASLTDTDARNGYPAASFTWLLVYQNQELTAKSYEEAKAVADLLWWIVHEGQRFNEDLAYGRLPDVAVEKAEALIKSLTYNGRPLIQ